MVQETDPKPRREIRIPIPDLDGLKASASNFAEKAKEVNRRPPQWLYWVSGIAVFIIVKLIFVAFRH